MIVDKLGRVIKEGDHVIKPQGNSSGAWLEFRTVEKIAEGKLYLDGNKGQAIRYPERLLIIPESVRYV